MNSIATCKQRLPLPELLVRLGLFDQAPKAGNHKCPLHHERNGASFGMDPKNEGWVWICRGKCATGGDELSLLETFLGLETKAAIRAYEHLAGIGGLASFSPPCEGANAFTPAYHRPLIPNPAPVILKPMPIELPHDLHKGSFEECATVSQLRAVPVETTLLMSKAGLLAFAKVAGFPSWIVLDDTRLIAEARRMDGALYPQWGSLAERKTHTLKGSHKSWPLGLTQGTGPILLVEGSGDFVAANYFCAFTHRTPSPWTPVAMLGASIKQLDPEAAELFAGRHVRIVPHVDAAGKKAATQWANLLTKQNCDVDGFDLSGLTKTDGNPVKDLNDATSLTATHGDALRQLFSPTGGIL